VSATITVGDGPEGVAITPDGTKAYVTNCDDDTVSVIDTATNSVVGSPIRVGDGPEGVAITPDGTKAYVTNCDDDTVSVIKII
jgi:YVTN family beta-propeller protein